MFDQYKPRLAVALLLVIVIVLGLTTRSDTIDWPVFIFEHAGDVLWAVALYLSLKYCFITFVPLKLALATVVISFAVEFSQLLDIGWLNAVRQHTLGGLLLGYDFVRIDLVRLCVGAMTAFVVDSMTFTKHKQF